MLRNLRFAAVLLWAVATSTNALVTVRTSSAPIGRALRPAEVGGSQVGVRGRLPSQLRLFQEAEEKEEEEDDDLPEPRLSKTEETVAAFVVGATMAAGAGVEILDAGAVGSALLAGAAVGFAAENDRKYGVGAVARGVGKIGWSAFQAAMDGPPEPEPVEDTIQPENFEDRMASIRREQREDQEKAKSNLPRFSSGAPDSGPESD